MECDDAKCPIHGSLKTRGAQLQGKVVSAKAKKTAIVEINYTRYINKYERYLRKRSRIPSYNPDCIAAKEGNIVNIAETRRLSKTKTFAVTGIVK
ncbi:MAG TPA: 30S ribosomal protein S17 [Candidatus Saccharimonadales bacterium]|nr:30S ribosomal protein S17 [Candidatus Saccharimonadales bacterium]